jgi:F0F1-type ATP synthase assembly protein I
MFVPTIGGTLLGAYLDTQFGTYPVWVIICIILGVAITTLLIRNQLKKP